MTEPVPIFDAAAWCERWLWLGGKVDPYSGSVAAPLALYLGAGNGRQQELCRMFRRLGPLHREAVRRFWRSGSRRAFEARFIGNRWG